MDLTDRVALVTGAARGIGKAIADAFAENGAIVVYTDLDAEAAAAALGNARCLAKALDVRDEAQVVTTIADVADTLGSLDIVVNNAGVNNADNRVTLDQYPSDDWARILDVDLNGVFFVSKAASRVMKARGSGKIINIASAFGLVPARLQSAYIAAKAGVVNLTRAMALELGGHGVLVNAIAPGSVLTEMTRPLFYAEDGRYKENTQRLLDHIPLGRPGEAHEIAHAALFLAAPESSYVNGHVLTVDGGWTAGYTREF